MFEQTAIESISILVFLIFMGMFLRMIKVFREEHSGIFSTAIIKVTLPALIFYAISRTEIEFDRLIIAGIMITSQFLCAMLAWFVASLLKLSKARKGAMILGSTFPSSAFLGYAVVKAIFPNDPSAIADCAIASELGVAVILFTFGVFIAMHYGKGGNSGKSIKKEISKFFYSPIFIALILGMGFSFVDIPFDNILVQSFYNSLHIISNANTFLVALTVGLMLHFKRLQGLFVIVILVIIIKLVIQPVITYGQALFYGLDSLQHQIVVLESSMPTAAMTAIFARKFGDDAELTSVLVFATFFSSCFTMIMLVLLLN